MRRIGLCGIPSITVCVAAALAGGCGEIGGAGTTIGSQASIGSQVATGSDAGAQTKTSPGARRLALQVLSSRPEYVSGGDALVAIDVPAAGDGTLEVKLNDEDITRVFESGHRGRRIGLVEGLVVGTNTLTARIGEETRSITLVNYPVTGPMFSGRTRAAETIS